MCGRLLPFPNSRRSPCLTSSGTFLPVGAFHRVDFLCFHCPSYRFLFVPPLAAPDIAWCAVGMQLPEEFHRPPHPLVPNFTLTNWPRVPLPLTSLCSPWQLGPVHEPFGPVRLLHNTAQITMGWTDGSWWNARHKAESKKEKEGGREGDCVWVVGVGFWLKIEPLSFSPFANFFVWQTLGTAAI